MSCGVDCRCGSELALLWLWRGPTAAALIRLLACSPKKQTNKQTNKVHTTQIDLRLFLKRKIKLLVNEIFGPYFPRSGEELHLVIPTLHMIHPLVEYRMVHCD